MTAYRCDDGNCEVLIDAETAEEAAQEYVDGGDWGYATKTFWVTVHVVKDGEEDGESHKVEVEPSVPKCSARQGHQWETPHEVVGGLRENPGVFGHGGGVTMTEVCAHCGCRKVTDTWAQDPVDGQQGLRSVSYEQPEDEYAEYAG